MHWYQWIASGAVAICLIVFATHFVRLIRLGSPKDYSKKAGSPAAGIVYSFTSAMDPRNKESAFLHLPIYTAGIIFHIATFASLITFFILLANFQPGPSFQIAAALIAFSGSLAGLIILIKRSLDKKLRWLSNPDDYISNLLVTIFQLFTGLTLLLPVLYPAYMLLAALLFLYMPVGKLKHIIYFFAARYHLGLFYGWRNVWPLRKA